MLTRTVLAAIAVAAVAAGGSTTVLVTASGNEHGLTQRSPRATEAQAKDHDADAEDVTTAEVDLPPCPADVKNHGAYVSSVAKANHGHAEDEGDTEETNHGALVSAAAQSDCGKPAGGDDESTTEESELSKEEKDAAKAARKAAKTHGNSADARANAPGQATTTP